MFEKYFQKKIKEPAWLEGLTPVRIVLSNILLIDQAWQESHKASLLNWDSLGTACSFINPTFEKHVKRPAGTLQGSLQSSLYLKPLKRAQNQQIRIALPWHGNLSSLICSERHGQRSSNQRSAVQLIVFIDPWLSSEVEKHNVGNLRTNSNTRIPENGFWKHWWMTDDWSFMLGCSKKEWSCMLEGGPMPQAKLFEGCNS